MKPTVISTKYGPGMVEVSNDMGFYGPANADIELRVEGRCVLLSTKRARRLAKALRKNAKAIERARDNR